MTTTQLAPAPVVSVVVPTHNRCQKLLECLRTLVQLDFPPDQFEVVVVDADSGDGTGGGVQELAAQSEAPRITYLRSAVADANTARNMGLEAARGELVVFVDDDVVIPSGWLGALLDGAAAHPQAGCLGGPVWPIYERKPPRTCRAHEPIGRLDHGPVARPVEELWGCNMAIRRQALADVGPWREGLRVHQDAEWQLRLLQAGGSMVYLPEAWLWTWRDADDLNVGAMLLDMIRRGYTWGLLGEPEALRHPLRRAAGLLAHALGARCTWALGEFARQVSLTAGILARRAGIRVLRGR